MKKILFTILILCISYVQAYNKETQAVIPLFIADIYSERIRDEIIRVVITYPSHSPMFYLERIETPEFKLLEQTTIDELHLENGETLTFDEDKIAGVYLNSPKFKGKEIHLPFEYFPARGSSFLVDCILPIGEKRFEAMLCTRKERPSNT